MSEEQIDLNNVTYHFNVAIAKHYGLDEAILYQNIKFWCDKNRANNNHFYDGHYWTYNSAAAFSKLFPFWNNDKIRRILTRMLEQKMIKQGVYNEVPTDRTYWYTDILSSAILSDSANMHNALCKNTECIMQEPQMHLADMQNAIITDINNIYKTKDINKLISSSENQNSHDINFFKYIPIIQRTAITKGTFTTRTKKRTKTIDTVIDYLKQIKNGSFLKIGLNKEWLEDQNINPSRIIGITTDEQLEKILSIAFTRFSKMKSDPGYWPKDKKNLKSLALPSFFFNPLSGKSWFLKCLSAQPEELKENMAATRLKQSINSLKKIEPNIEQLVGKVYNKEVIKKWDVSDQLAFYNTVRELIDWRLENKDVLKTLSEGWGSHFGSTSKLLGTVGRFIDIRHPSPFPRFLQIDGYNWKGFLYWSKDDLGVTLNIPKKKKEK